MKEYLIKNWGRIVLVISGAIAGFLYWQFVGCASGTCPITSHWYSSSAFGMLFGWLIGSLFKKKSSNQPPEKL